MHAAVCERERKRARAVIYCPGSRYAHSSCVSWESSRLPFAVVEDQKEGRVSSVCVCVSPLGVFLDFHYEELRKEPERVHRKKKPRWDTSFLLLHDRRSHYIPALYGWTVRLRNPGTLASSPAEQTKAVTGTRNTKMAACATEGVEWIDKAESAGRGSISPH